MFDIKSLLQRGVERELTNVDDYIFMPENIEIEIEGGGQLNCVLNSDGRVDIFYSRGGVTDVRSAPRKHPLTAFEYELHHGVYDDVIEELIKEVDKTLDSRSRYFSSKMLPMGAAITAEPFVVNK